ncbi:hypothetical protein [Shinella sp.]|uniref:hypothetical protein n=1 Tax=Shinella sp. TaxID=1870904 RepID=UPI00258CD8FF|nr:hypothetical protein [Shinella sp.]MCW5711301.1 hypothetical protein [Shinella sp.]
MTTTHRENIPFFNDIPTKAIPAAARLFDTIRTPGFNFPLAYSDFVGDLNRLKVDPPARALVKRWMAGVQGGFITRPGFDETSADTGLAHGHLKVMPETALPALQAAWDRARDKRFSVRSMLDLFSSDLSEIGCAPPSLPEMEGWIKAIRGGLIPRPERDAIAEDITEADPSERSNVGEDAPGAEIDDARQRDAPLSRSTGRVLFKPEAAFEKLTPSTFGGSAFSTLMEASITPPEPGDERPDPALALVARQMVEEEVARINFDVRAKAAAIVAARLRQMAAALDPSHAA